MKILSLSLDRNLLVVSPAQDRQKDYARLCEQMDIVVVANGQSAKVFDNGAIYPVNGVNKLIRLFKTYRLASELIRKNQYNILTVQDIYYIGFIGLLLKRKFKVSLELQIHGFEKFFGLRKFLFHYIINKADAIRVVSERLKQQLISDYKITTDKISVIPIFSLTETNIDNHQANSEKFVFLTVGRLVPVKNISMQLRALSQIPRFDKKIELHIVGDGPEKNNLEQEAIRLGVADQVKFFGHRDEVEKFYRQADAFLLTSDAEGWGLVIIEAASRGLPIIMTDVGCAGEVIHNNESGLIIPIGDEKKLAEKMQLIINDADLRIRLSRGAVETVKQLPSKENILEQIRNNWSAILKQRRSKILIITQKVDANDPILGFFHNWILEFSKKCSKVTVICLYEGQYDLPDNVKILSLGKERGCAKWQYLINFYKYIISECNHYDSVFVHMNQIYVILGAIFWKLLHKRIGLWYTHKNVSRSLILAEKLVDIIFSASDKSFRLPSKKLFVTGHGIDTSLFTPTTIDRGDRVVILTSGRICSTKKIMEIILVAEELNNRKIDLLLKMAGEPIYEHDIEYLKQLKKYIIDHNLTEKVLFVGSIPNKKMPEFLNSGDIFINLSDTGSMDKAILEAMSCGLKILTSNEAFRSILKPINFCDSNDCRSLADSITKIIDTDDGSYSNFIEDNYKLSALIDKIMEKFKTSNIH